MGAYELTTRICPTMGFLKEGEPAARALWHKGAGVTVTSLMRSD